MKNKMELYIGVFVLIALIMLGTMIINFGGYEYSGKRYIVYAMFNFIGGVVEGAPVRYAGVDVGKVIKATLVQNGQGGTKVRLSMSIDEDVKMKTDSWAVINSLGIIGEKYAEIFPGTSGAPDLVPDGTIIGEDPIAIELVIGKAQKAIEQIQDALTAVNNILSSDTQADVRAAVTNFRDCGQRIGNLTKKLEALINQINSGRGTAGKLVYAQELHDELLALIKGIREHGIFYKSKDAAKEVKKADKKGRVSVTSRSKKQ